jgi:hypothetical protein
MGGLIIQTGMNHKLSIQRIFIPLLLLGFAISSLQAQPGRFPAREKAKPYKLLTAGRQITIRGNLELASVMVWTAGGHRVLEQKDIYKTEYRFELTVPARIYFIMIRFKDGQSFSEKIGI